MSSRGDGAHAERPAFVAAPGQEPAAADTSPAAPAADDTEMAGVEASTVAQMRVPTFGVRYLEQARRQLFARHPEYLPFLVRHLGVHPGMTVVDVGCGTGIYTRVLASQLHGEGDAIAIDLQPALIAHAHQITHADGWGQLAAYIPGDATALPLPAPCTDVVFCSSFL